VKAILLLALAALLLGALPVGHALAGTGIQGVVGPIPGGTESIPEPLAGAPTATPTSTPTSVPTPAPVHLSPPPWVGETENILILGTDQRAGGQTWRTDTIMVVAIDYRNQQIGIISIPRDLWVEIPGYGMSRINQADFLGETWKYPGGGAALTGKLIEETLGIPTQHWVRLKYEGLPRLVDTLGGVTVHLDCPLYERTPDATVPGRYVDWSLPAGDITLDGATAKKFVTYRYLTNDSGRARRQQQLIWAIRDRALQLDIVPKIPELWRALSDVFSTDLNLLDILRLAQLGAGLHADAVHSLVLGMEVMGNYITPSGAWVLVVRDPAKLASEVANLFSGVPLAELAHNQAPNGKCPPAPRSFTSLQATATPSPTAAPTATVP
jgi:LCP family protein required for cell wall assembly